MITDVRRIGERSRVWRWFRRGCIVALFGLLGLFVLEGFVRLIGIAPEIDRLIKPEGTFRILGLGDSFTAGWGAAYEETYLRRSEVALNARDGRSPAG